jgi:L-ascorbate metabolism protein UlaG (beta-lactamase superfamily)
VKAVGVRRVLIGLGVLVAVLAGGWLAAQEATRYYSGPVSPHWDGERFRVPGVSLDKPFGEFLRWQRTRQPAVWPERIDNPAPDVPPVRMAGDTLRVSFVGHATVLLQTADLNILTDPVWAERASPVSFSGPKRVRAPGIRFADLPPIDVVLVSHNHYDHLCAATLQQLVARDNPLIVTALGNDTIIRRIARSARVVALDWGQSHAVNDQVRIAADPMQHWSSRLGFDRNRALWAALTVDTPGGKLLFVGDTGYGRWWIDVLKARHGAFRFAILPIGAYEPRWFMAPQHMNPAEAVQAFEALGGMPTLGHHFGTFQLTDEAVDAPEQALAAALQARGLAFERFRALQPGQVWLLPAPGAGG